MFANFWPHSMAGFSSTTTHYPTSRLPLPDRASALRGMFGVPRDLDQAKYYLERGAEAVGEFLWCQKKNHQKSVMVMHNSDIVHLWWIISKSWTEYDEFWWSWFTLLKKSGPRSWFLIPVQDHNTTTSKLTLMECTVLGLASVHLGRTVVQDRHRSTIWRHERSELVLLISGLPGRYII